MMQLSQEEINELTDKLYQAGELLEQATGLGDDEQYNMMDVGFKMGKANNLIENAIDYINAKHRQFKLSKAAFDDKYIKAVSSPTPGCSPCQSPSKSTVGKVREVMQASYSPWDEDLVRNYRDDT